VEGKTAALFRWALAAGAAAGGLEGEARLALERYGKHLGVAFQLVDDRLDYGGDEALTGKLLFADLREGKLTYPLIVALERDPSVELPLRELLSLDPLAPEAADPSRLLLARIEALGGLEECRLLALEQAERAVEALSILPQGPARAALETVALSTVHRQR
ncbi:MAG: polyprenyl synthetase family protein, partial [Myxococcales bacterium]|nr:polyprenyl synthetase family protein [Myxococcales bacterium]